MFKWRLGKKVDMENETPIIRLARRMDVLVAIRFLNGKRKVWDNPEKEENEAMFVRHLGFLRLKEYLHELEYGIEN